PDRRDVEYGLRDTARAIEQARGRGIDTLLVTVDRASHDYLRRMCPPGRYRVIEEIDSLAGEIARAYRTMTGRWSRSGAVSAPHPRKPRARDERPADRLVRQGVVRRRHGTRGRAIGCRDPGHEIVADEEVARGQCRLLRRTAEDGIGHHHVARRRRADVAPRIHGPGADRPVAGGRHRAREVGRPVAVRFRLDDALRRTPR